MPVRGGEPADPQLRPDSRKPWPWVVDELRVLDAGTLVGMTIVDVPGPRALGGTPFLLHRD